MTTFRGSLCCTYRYLKLVGLPVDGQIHIFVYYWYMVLVVLEIPVNGSILNNLILVEVPYPTFIDSGVLTVFIGYYIYTVYQTFLHNSIYTQYLCIWYRE